MNKRKIAVFTGNRAEYGLQYPILKAIDENPSLEYQLIVSGAHLDASFGNTLEEIQKDGFDIAAEVAIDMDGTSAYSTTQAIGSGVLSIGEALQRLQPDVFVVYADRFEGFAAVVAATQMNIPTAHIEGGDITEGGALDDSIRHAMTKLAHIHFTTNEEASNRILAMGEENWRIHTVGFPAIDLISEDNFATEAEVIAKLGVDTTKPIVLFTQHSITIEPEISTEQMQGASEALINLANNGVQVIATYPNNDAGCAGIIEILNKLENTPNIQLHRSLGRYMYHGVLALAKDKNKKVVCAGNSSSGIKETPVFGCPTVNIGSRQNGRLRGENVLDCLYNAQDIEDAINKCLFDDDVRKMCHNTSNPYYLGGAGEKIAGILKTVVLDKELLRKKMTLSGSKLVEITKGLR